MSRSYHPGYAGTDSVGNPQISSVELGLERTAIAPRHGSTEQVQGLWQNDQRYSITDLQKMAGSGQPFAKYSPQGVARTILPPPANRWKPRSGIGFAVWASDIKERITMSDLLDTSSSRAPTLDDTAVVFPSCGQAELINVYMEALAEYRDENTALFHLIMNTVDLSGIRQETDIAYIEQKIGRDRLGALFLERNSREVVPAEQTRS